MLAWPALGTGISTRPGAPPFDRVSGVPALVIGVASDRGRQTVRIVDASGHVGYVAAPLTFTQGDLRLKDQAILTSEVDAPGVEVSEAFTTIRPEPGRVELLEASEDLYFGRVTDQGASGPFDALRRPWLRVKAGASAGWISPLELSVGLRADSCKARPPRGLVRAELGFLDPLQTQALALAPAKGTRATLLTPFDDDKSSRTVDLTDGFRCGTATHAYFRDQRGSQPQAAVVSCTNPGGEFEYFDAFVGARGTGLAGAYVVQPETQLRLLRIDERKIDESRLVTFVEVGSQSSEGYSKGLLVLSPATTPPFRYVSFGDEGSLVTWTIHDNGRDFFVVSRDSESGVLSARWWAYGDGTYVERPAFLALGATQPLLSAQEAAFRDPQTLLVSVHGENSWRLAHPFGDLARACAHAERTGEAVVTDGDSVGPGGTLTSKCT